MIRDLDWDPSLHPVVNPHIRIRCINCIATYVICNPTTRELIPLEKLHERDGIGFGFDAAKNQYKLVLLHLSDESTWCKIFTLRTNSWSRAKNDDPTMPTNKGKALYPPTIGESIYWITTGKFKWVCVPMYIQNKKKQLEQNTYVSLVEVLGSLSMVKYSINLNNLPEHTAPGYHVILIGIRGGNIILWSTWMGLVSYD
ncbi:hypothetical protein MKX01_006808, partial [Papaver californicum]